MKGINGLEMNNKGCIPTCTPSCKKGIYEDTKFKAAGENNHKMQLINTAIIQIKSLEGEK